MEFAYKYRCSTNTEQRRMLAQTFGTTRFVYNWALEQRSAAFQAGGRMNYSQSSAALTQLKKTAGFEWMKGVSSVPQQQALRNLNQAFQKFFNKKARYPTFKKKGEQQSAKYVRSGFTLDDKQLILGKVNYPALKGGA